MSDRIKGFAVVLEEDYKDEDFEAIKHAVLMIKGIVKVIPSKHELGDCIIEMRVKSKIREQILKVLQ